jgi:hypothetical protein
MTDTVLYVDNTYGTISGSLTAAATSITLTAGHGARFPAVAANQILYATLLNSANVLEQIHITAHTLNSDTLTVTRAANGTTAKAWAAGDRIECRLTSEHMTTFGAFRDTAASWTKGQRGTPVALTSTSSAVAVDMNAANNFTLAMTENTTLSSATNVAAGQSGLIAVTQNSTAAKTLAYNGFWKFPAGVVPTLTTALGAVDVISYCTITSTSAACNMQNDVK